MRITGCVRRAFPVDGYEKHASTTKLYPEVS
jgi:hypothetical protein